MDPILIENLGDAAKEYLEGVGHQFSENASLVNNSPSPISSGIALAIEPLRFKD